MLHGRKYDYSYDARGNQEYRYLIADKSAYWHYSWNAKNQLTTAELVGSGTTLRSVGFQYEAFGRRTQKSVTMDSTTTTTDYVYDGEDIILQLTSSGSTTHFVHGPGIDEPLAMVTDGSSYFYHADGLGSIIALTNASQTVVQRYSYDIFGMVSASDATFANSYAFTGREWDKELGLHYYRARYYDPMDGRFIAKDPIGFAGGDVNVYGYVGTRVAGWRDPSGLDGLEALTFGMHSGDVQGIVYRQQVLEPYYRQQAKEFRQKALTATMVASAITATVFAPEITYFMMEPLAPLVIRVATHEAFPSALYVAGVVQDYYITKADPNFPETVGTGVYLAGIDNLIQFLNEELGNPNPYENECPNDYPISVGP